LQSAFERQRQFTADASHELRTPLTIIGLETSRVLEAKRQASEYERTLRVIQNENEHMTHLVNDLLTLSRLESGQTQPQMERVDLSDTALEVVERLAPLAAARHIHLEAGELPEAPVLGDRAILVQMVSNLVENAIKYAPETSGRVLVETGCEGQQAWVRVEDNGPGIAAEDLAHLFERFYRADKARMRATGGDPGGSGLGLAIVQWVARAHGGEVQVSSQLGAGSTFEVRIPSKS
jgi:signal transduction histidine kinase